MEANPVTAAAALWPLQKAAAIALGQACQVWGECDHLRCQLSAGALPYLDEMTGAADRLASALAKLTQAGQDLITLAAGQLSAVVTSAADHLAAACQAVDAKAVEFRAIVDQNAQTREDGGVRK